MNRGWLCGMLGFVLWSGAAFGADSRPQSFQSLFDSTLASEGIPGGAYVIVRAGRITETGTFGLRSLGRKEAVDADTVFRLASVSKTITAQLAGLLVHDGRMTWNDRLHESIPSLKFADARLNEGLEIRHLLSHTTGISPYAFDRRLEGGQSLDAILPAFSRERAACRPGDCFTYQNVLFSVSTRHLEWAGGASFDKLVRERIFDPLDMRSASIGIDGYRASGNSAAPHVRNGGAFQVVAVDTDYYSVPGAAGINASITDMGRFLCAQMGANRDALPESVVAALVEPRARTPRDLRMKGWKNLITDAHYGLGWRIYGIGDETIVLHSGWVKGFLAHVSYSREHRIGLAMLINADEKVFGTLGSEFWRVELSGGSP